MGGWAEGGPEVGGCGCGGGCVSGLGLRVWHNGPRVVSLCGGCVCGLGLRVWHNGPRVVSRRYTHDAPHEELQDLHSTLGPHLCPGIHLDPGTHLDPGASPVCRAHSILTHLEPHQCALPCPACGLQVDGDKEHVAWVQALTNVVVSTPGALVGMYLNEVRVWGMGR